jgi:hypothetical protein
MLPLLSSGIVVPLQSYYRTEDARLQESDLLTLQSDKQSIECCLVPRDATSSLFPINFLPFATSSFVSTIRFLYAETKT